MTLSTADLDKEAMNIIVTDFKLSIPCRSFILFKFVRYSVAPSAIYAIHQALGYNLQQLHHHL